MFKTVLERFLEKVYPEPNTGCWLWGGGKRGPDYGGFSFEGRHEAAHRISYILHHGKIVDDLKVCHTCDVPLCVNPEHLFLCTQKENVEDAVRKGRARHFQKIPPEKWKHGTWTTFQYRKCRCDLCKLVGSNYYKKQDLKKKNQTPL